MSLLIAKSYFYSNGFKLAGDLYYNSDTAKLPVIILCQGLSGVKHKVLPNIARQFALAGFIIFAFDYQGCGESEGPKNEISPQNRVKNILSAIDFIKSLKNVDSDSISLYGLSYGASASIYAAIQNKSIKSVVAVSGAVDGKDFMKGLRTLEDWILFKKSLIKDFADKKSTGHSKLVPITDIIPFSKGFWEKYNKLDNKNNSESIPDTSVTKNVPAFTLESAKFMIDFNLSSIIDKLNIPTLIIHGEVDNIIAIEDVIKIYDLIKSTKNIKTFPKYDHIDLDQGPGLELQIKHSIKWFLKYGIKNN